MADRKDLGELNAVIGPLHRILEQLIKEATEGNGLQLFARPTKTPNLAIRREIAYWIADRARRHKLSGDYPRDSGNEGNALLRLAGPVSAGDAAALKRLQTHTYIVPLRVTKPPI